MAAIYTAVIRPFRMDECDTCFQLDLHSYSSEEGQSHEFTADYFGSDAEAKAVAQAWTGGQHEIIRSAVRLAVPQSAVMKMYVCGVDSVQSFKSANVKG